MTNQFNQLQKNATHLCIGKTSGSKQTLVDLIEKDDRTVAICF